MKHPDRVNTGGKNLPLGDGEVRGRKPQTSAQAFSPYDLTDGKVAVPQRGFGISKFPRLKKSPDVAGGYLVGTGACERDRPERNVLPSPFFQILGVSCSVVAETEVGPDDQTHRMTPFDQITIEKLARGVLRKGEGESNESDFIDSQVSHENAPLTRRTQNVEAGFAVKDHAGGPSEVDDKASGS